MKKTLVLFSIFLCAITIFGQKENYIWLIGENNKLNFHKYSLPDTISPFVSDTSINIITNNFVYSDEFGNVIFYSNGDTIFSQTDYLTFGNYENATIPLIAKIDYSGSTYDFNILFTEYNSTNNNYKLISYSTTYDGTWHTPIIQEINNVSSKVADYFDGNYHFVVHELGSNNFILCDDPVNFHLDTISIGATYPTIAGLTYDSGFMKFSPDGYYLAVSSPLVQDLRIYQTDILNSTLFGEQVFNGQNFNSIEFSIFNNILYVATDYDIYQLDLMNSNPTLQHIANTSYIISNMQLAPDGKIYVAKEGDTYLGAIENPEIRGENCFYNDTELLLPTPSNGTLPYTQPNTHFNAPVLTWAPDTIYFGDNVSFYFSYAAGIDSIHWLFSDDSYASTYADNELNISFLESGIYELKAQIFTTIGDTIFINRHFIVSDRQYIYPHDTIICDTNNFFILTANIPASSPDYYRVWYKPDGTIDSTDVAALTVNQPGVYILKLYDTGSGTLAVTDTAVVYSFVPSLTIDDYNDSVFYENENLYLSSYLFQIPWDTIDPMEISYIWEISDNIVLGGNYDFLDTIFEFAGEYPVDVTIHADICAYSVQDTIEILPEVAIDTGFLSLHDTTVCDTPLNIVLSVPYPPDDYDIEWYFNDETMLFAYSDTVETYFPGKYSVFIYSIGTDQLIGEDIAFIHYKYCDDFSMNINVNNNGYACDSNYVFNFSADIAPQYNSCEDISSYFYIWDFGNGNSESGNNLTNVSQTFQHSGEYHVTLFVYDSGNCEHIFFKNIHITQASTDTAIINLSESSENITINFDKYPVFETPYLTNNQFISTRIKNIFVNNPVIDCVYVSNSTIETTQENSDITLFVTGSFKGNINLNLIAPDGTSLNVLNAVSDTVTFLFGRQAIIYENIPQSVPQTYIFSSSGKDFDDFDENYFANIYYSPDEYTFTDENYYYVPFDNYRFSDYQSLTDLPINGSWKLEVSIDDFFGRLNTWGLIFNKDYFQTTIRPDSVTCTDQFGNEYQMHNNSIEIQNSAVSRYDLDCKVHYSQTQCVVDKHLVITVPSIPNVFTPNGDGINDTWISASPDINAHVIVIDKIGRIVADYNTQDKPEGWDGTYNGKPLPSDSYWYIITLENGTPIKGVVSIVR